ncbi:MAG TPA: tetratricopeptide repeat protein [Kofleriaceae bacterium]|jgi:tetratricopeptide (TPR) repeat protein
MLSNRRYTLATLCALTLAGCGSKSDKPTAEKKDAGSGGPQVAPLTAPPSGIDKIARMNFVYAEGWPAYDKAVALRAKGDAAGARAQLEASIAKDPDHLDAHYLLAKVLAQAGEHAAAVDHLVTALGGDYYKYGPALLEDKDFTEFLATPHGDAVKALAQRIGADYAKRVASGLWLVGRRSTFKWPTQSGAQSATTRGELYAYDRETKRYLRLSHTDHKVAGYVRSPSGKEIALLGWDRIDHAKADDDASTFAAGWVIVLDTTTWQPIGKRIALPAAREYSIGYADDQLLAGTAQEDGRWSTKDPQTLALDEATGKATKSTAMLPVPRIAVTLDEGRLVRAPEGLVAVWSGEPPTTPSFKTGGGTEIAIPESHAAWQSSFAVAPTSGRVAFATAVDPCAKGVESSLYVSDGKTASLKHLLTMKSRFANRWLDADTLAYEDGKGSIRLWDATTARQSARLENAAGIALDVLSLAPARLCKGETPVDAPDGAVGGDTGSGSAAAPSDDEPMPPEEPAK